MDGHYALIGATHPAPGAPEDRELTLRDVWGVFVRNRWRVAAVTLGTMLLAGAYVWIQEPVYESSATLQIDSDSPGFSFLTELAPLAGAAGGGGGTSIETEMLVLQSRRIAEQVVDSLALHVALSEPELPRTEVLRVLNAPQTERLQVYELILDDDGRYTARNVRGRTEGEGPVAGIGIGRPFRLGELELSLVGSLQQSPPERIEILVLPFRNAVAAFQRTLQVSRPSRDVQIISVRYQHTDPQLAADAANVSSAHYIQHRSLTSKTESSGTVEFLRQQVAAYEDQLRDAESQLEAYREQEQVISPQEEATEQVRRLASMQAQRDALRSDRDALAKLLQNIRAQPPSEGGGQSPYRQLAAFPVFLANQAVQNMLQSITELENQRAELLVRRTAQNVDVRGINERISELELQLYQTANSYLESVDSQLASLDANLARFGAELQRIPARELAFARLLRTESLLAELYTLLQTRLKEAEIREAVTPLDVRVLDSALVPQEPVSPRPVRTLAIAAVLGLIFGTVLAFLREAMDTKVRTEDDVRMLSNGVPLVGLVPTPPGVKTGAALDRLGLRRRLPAGAAADGDQHLAARDVPKGNAAEAFRALRTNLRVTQIEHPPRTILVTSAMPPDGKSVTAANLAVTLAQQGSRVLLVDADLRKGRLHELLGVSRDPGLTHVLLDEQSLDSAVRHVISGGGGEDVHFLPAGGVPLNPAELLGSETMRRLLGTLREQYDAVILDGPPLGVVTDSMLLGMAADATLVVARAGATEKDALQRAIAQLRQVRAPLGGIVLSGTEGSDASDYYDDADESAFARNGRQ